MKTYLSKYCESLNKKVSLCLFLCLSFPMLGGCEETSVTENPSNAYPWTREHMHVGVRWQPFDGRPQSTVHDATRAVISEDSSYVQFWFSWAAAESQIQHTDYVKSPSGYFKTIEQAIDECVRRGLKVELVLWHAPAWATVSGQSGPFKPKQNEYKAFVERLAKYYKGRVHAYQLYHEINMKSMFQDGDVDYLIKEAFVKGGPVIREVYNEKPALPVMISTSGISPCEACPATDGLGVENGGDAANNFYDKVISNKSVMKTVDALNINVSDHYDGYGNMDGAYIASSWGNYDLVREKLDAKGYDDITILASESWVVWDDAGNAVDVNGDGKKDEKDAYVKTLTLMGQLLERGLNTFNLPWSDNSSGWAMGLTKRQDYNGKIKAIRPDIVIPSTDGSPDVVTRKLNLGGSDNAPDIKDGADTVFTVEDYINPGDPNHLHYYIWRWFAQIAGGSDEVIRHTIPGEAGNQLRVKGPGFVGNERYQISSYNRTKEKFTVLLYANGANGKSWTQLYLPSTIQNGKYYNNDASVHDYRGEGIPAGAKYGVVIESKDISLEDGSDQNKNVTKEKLAVVPENGIIYIPIMNMRNFTKVEVRRIND